MMRLDKYKALLKKLFFILLPVLIIFIYIKSETIKDIANIILIAFTFAYTLKPLRNAISEKFNITKRISSIIIIIIIVIGITLLLYMIIPKLLKEGFNFEGILENLNLYMQELAYKLNINNVKVFDNFYNEINEGINGYIENFSNNFLENIMGIFTNLISCAVIPVVTYYFLVDGDIICNKLLLIFPTEKRVVVKKLLCNIDKILARYIISQLLLSAIIGVLTYIMLIILKVKFSLVLAILNGVLNIIPYFGPIIGGIPAVFIALLDSPGKAVLTIVGVFILQQIEGNILSPKITGDSTNMHPIVIIILLLIGEKLGGFTGMILAVPIGVIVKVIYEDINNYLFWYVE